MDTIELWDGSTKAVIDPIGAWLTNLSDEFGDILYPKRTLNNANGESKLRGGCHVCLPNFGPGGDSGQPQHGFGREAIWEMKEQHPSKAVLELKNGKGEYDTLQSFLTYTLGQSSMAFTLELTNSGERPLRVAPGFHPYFALDRDEGQVTLNGNQYDVQDLAGTEFFVNKTTMDLKLRRRNIKITSENLPTWAFWTDQLGEYVCCEPTVGGYTFLDVPRDIEKLLPGKTASYTFTISW